MKDKKKETAPMCKCGYPMKKNPDGCPCGSKDCSKTGPDGYVCDNPYHSQDI